MILRPHRACEDELCGCQPRSTGTRPHSRRLATTARRPRAAATRSTRPQRGVSPVVVPVPGVAAMRSSDQVVQGRVVRPAVLRLPGEAESRGAALVPWSGVEADSV